MRLEDSIKQSILDYPTLYKDVDYARSRLQVLDQMFIVLGNGYDISPQGYLGSGGIWKPYGEEKYEGPEMDETYFSTDIVEYAFSIELLNDLANGINDVEEFEHIRKLSTKTIVQESKRDFSPYPFSTISNISKVANQKLFLHPDWIEGGIDVCRAALAYYKDPARYVDGSYYPSASDIRRDAQDLLDRRKKSPEEYEKLREIWSYEPGQSVVQHKVKGWVEYHTDTVAEYRKIIEILGGEVSPDELAIPTDYDTLLQQALEDLEKPHETSRDLRELGVTWGDRDLSDYDHMLNRFARGEITVEEAVEAL